METSIIGVEADAYWCPSHRQVDPATKEAQSLEPGICTDYVKPLDNGCMDHYDAVSSIVSLSLVL